MRICSLLLNMKFPKRSSEPLILEFDSIHEAGKPERGYNETHDNSIQYSSNQSFSIHPCI